MKRIFSIISIILCIFGFYIYFTRYSGKISKTAFAVGDLIIDWGVPPPSPIFVIDSMLPGDSMTRTVTVTNDSIVSRTPVLQAIRTNNSIAFSDSLTVVISENGHDIYGGISSGGIKTLSNLFDQTASPGSIVLSHIIPSESSHYSFTVGLPTDAPNALQGSTVRFTIVFGLDVSIPDECRHIHFSGEPIYGTAKNDRIFGTIGNDLIYALEGNDMVYGLLGDDCIIGGQGKDILRGETGDDVIFGNEGDDMVIGAVGNDMLYGNDGKDTMRGEDGDDYLEGGNSHDVMNGGSGNDMIYGNDGNDKIKGGSGNDVIRCDEGKDTADGESGNDVIDGGDGNDVVNGSSGIDTCISEVKLQCEF